MGNRLKSLWPLGWLLLLSLLSLLPLVFFRRVIHNDLAVQTFPLLLYANDAFRAGLLPLWDPFQDCGMPHFSNPQAHLWYPTHQLIFWTSGYSIYSMQYEFIFHFFLAGLSLYVLARKFKLSQAGAALSASSYMLSGIFVGNAEHFNIVITFVWLPLVLAGIQGWFDDQRKRNLWLTGIGLWLLLQGGNPSTNLIALFFIGLFLIIRAADKIYARAPGKALLGQIFSLLMAFAVAGLISGIMLAPVLADFAEYSGRQGGVGYQAALEFNPLRVWSLVSLVLPSASFRALLNGFEETGSPGMLNCYLGIITLMLALWAIYTKRDRGRLILLMLGLFALLTALGGRSVFRGLLYEAGPFFRMFKHPALFRGVFILFLCLLAGFGLDDLCAQGQSFVDKFRRIVLLALVCLGLTLGFAAALTVALVPGDADAALLLKSIFLESLPIQFGLLLALSFWLRGQRKYWKAGILVLAGLDLSFMVQWNLPQIADNFDYRARSALVDSVEKRSRQLRGLTNRKRLDNWPAWENNGMVYKRFETSDYATNSSVTYGRVMDTGFHQVVAEAPYFFLVPAVSMQDRLELALPIFARASQEKAMPAMVMVEPPLPIRIIHDAFYPLASLNAAGIKVISYSINRVELEFANSAPAVLASTEGYHPGWQATLDGNQVDTVRFNFAFRAVYVPSPGVHRLVWEFRPKSFYLGIWITAFGLLLLAVWIGVSRVRSKTRGLTGS